MANPHVYEIDSIEGIDGNKLPVGVDYNAVSVGPVRFHISNVGLLHAALSLAAFHAGKEDEAQDDELTGLGCPPGCTSPFCDCPGTA